MKSTVSSYCKKASIKRCLEGFSIEITPRQARKIQRFDNVEGLKPGTRVNVTSLPGSDHAEAITTCRQLSNAGMLPVAHVPVRAFPSLASLDGHFARLREAGVNDVLILAGSAPMPAGGVENSIQLLESDLLSKHGFDSIAAAGHPEGHPMVPSAALDDAISRKVEWWWKWTRRQDWRGANGDAARALSPRLPWPPSSRPPSRPEQVAPAFHFETQFGFTAAPVLAWEAQVRRRLERLRRAYFEGPAEELVQAAASSGSHFPLPTVRVGVAGPARRADLERFAAISGVGASALHTLKRDEQALENDGGSDESIGHSGLRSSNEDSNFPVAPDRIIMDVAEHAASDSNCLIRGLHFYSFGGFRKTLRWASAVERGDFELKPKVLGGGFAVCVPPNDHEPSILLSRSPPFRIRSL